MKDLRILMAVALLICMSALTSCVNYQTPTDDAVVEDIVSQSDEEGVWWLQGDGSDDDDGSALDLSDDEVSEGGSSSDVDSAEEPSDLSDPHFVVAEDSFALEVGDSISEQFIVSPCSGNHYEWEVQGLPDWLEDPELTGSCDQNLIISTVSGGVPSAAGGQSFTVTLIATDVDSGKSAAHELAIDVEQFVPIQTLTDTCDQELTIEWEDGFTDMTGTLGSSRYITVSISGGKKPYHVYWNSWVWDSFHCLKDGKKYGEENAYYYPETLSCAEDQSGRHTGNQTWASDDIVDHDKDPMDDLAGLPNSGWMAEDDNTLVISGRFEYDGPLPISKFIDADGLDDLNRHPVEVLDISVTDSCEPEVIDLDDGRKVTRVNTAGAQLKYDIHYPTDDLAGNIKVDMKFRDWSHMESNSRFKIFFATEPVYSFSDEGTMAKAVFDLSDITPGTPADPNFEKWAHTTVYSTAGSDAELVRDISHVLFLWEGLCAYEDDYHDEKQYPEMDVIKIVMQSPYWEAVYHDGLNGNLYDEIETNYQCRREDHVVYSDGWTSGNIDGWRFKRRELPDYGSCLN